MMLCCAFKGSAFIEMNVCALCVPLLCCVKRDLFTQFRKDAAST